MEVIVTKTWKVIKSSLTSVDGWGNSTSSETTVSKHSTEEEANKMLEELTNAPEYKEMREKYSGYMPYIYYIKPVYNE